MRIIVSRIRAIENVEANKAKHIEEYADQLAGWKIKMDEYGKHLSDWAASNAKRADREEEPERPVNYVEEYDNLLAMLDWHIEESLELSECDFNKIVKDEFHWSGIFTSNSSMYSSR